jgi:pyruvate/2-oxoglutarate dehydrogenase complex dihydrolipoamide acyltransferase (E2) component
MPLDVIMPALGMAQDSGVIVSWLKQPGDKVATGDPLFEVETDKATMEVEAQGGGYLTDVTVVAGEAAPVGQVIARISDTAEGSGDAPAPKAAEKTAPEAAMPKGREIIMPALGMAQDTGLLIAWRKAPGDKIGADDILFEVETDKSAVEVPCGVSGYVAALLAEAGEEIPVGGVVAIISDAKPDAPFARSAKGAPAPEPKAATPAPEKALAAKPDPVKPAAKPSPMRHDGKILASPKMRRLALERGLDLRRLADAGHPQPFHVKDLDILRDLPADAAPAPDAAPAGAMATGVGARRLCAQLGASGFGAFCDRAAKTLGVKDPHALLSGFAAASLRTGDDTLIIEVIALSAPQCYVDPDRPWLGRAEPQAPDAPATLRIRDLRHSLLTSINAGPEDCPVLTLTQAGDTVSVTLECAADQLSAQAAVTLLTDFAGRMEQPLRHLL